MFSYLSILGKSVLIVALAAGLLTQFFPCCAFAIRSFSKVSATPAKLGQGLQTEFAGHYEFPCKWTRMS